MEVPKKIKDEIWEYCRLNDIPNIDDFIIKMVRQGFTVEKYGSSPGMSTEVREVEKVVEVIKEVEKIVNVPVEIIKEVIVEKEVPVEKVVTKIEYISDKTTENDLVQKISAITEELESERKNFSTIIAKMEKNFHEDLSNKDKELEDLRILLEKDDRDNKIVELSDLIEEEKISSENYRNEASKKDKELEELKNLLEEEKKKNKNSDDIYGDDRRGGWFGSNLLRK